MAQQTTIHTQNKVMQTSRQPAMHLLEADRRGVLHPRYMARRKADGANLMKHALGTLLVLGALTMMANT